MKIKVLAIAFIGAAVLATSCNKKAEETTEPAVEEIVDTTAVAAPVADTTAAPAAVPATPEHKDNDVIEVAGKVTEINQGKDGYTAKISTAEGKAYSATISIPNLDNPKQYRAVKVGDNITVKGIVTNLESDVLIRVKELK